MKRTENGKINEMKVEQEFDRLNKKLNLDEMGELVHIIVKQLGVTQYRTMELIIKGGN